MRRPPSKDTTKPERPARDPAFDFVKATPDEVKPGGNEDELAARIERLEKRIDESVRGNEGVALGLDAGVDRSETEDALKRAVSRSNGKRDQKS